MNHTVEHDPATENIAFVAQNPGDIIEKECISCGRTQPHSLHSLQLAVDDPEYAAHLIAQCTVCSLHSAFPMPTDDDLRRTYARRPHVANIASGSFLGNIIRSYRDTKKINMLKQLAPSGTVVDVGTGTGLFLRLARKAGDWDLIGTDYSKVNVAKLQADGFDARFGTLDGIGIEPESVDVIWASHVIEHMIDPPAFLATVQRYLKPGGVLVVFVPSETSLRSRLGTSNWHIVNPPGHLWGFRPTTFRPIVERSGLKVEKLRNSSLVCELICVARKAT